VLTLLLGIWATTSASAQQPAESLRVGFAEADITPKLDAGPIFMAGFGQNRKATAIHDPLLARAIVLSDGTKKIAIVSVDLVGLSLPQVTPMRQRLPGFA